MSDAVLELSGIRRRFRQGSQDLEILKGIDLSLGQRSITALVGPSGTGKSTLLHICGLLERPSDGEVFITGQRCSKLSDARRTALRRETIGFVYQSHHLLPDFTALENVLLPQLLAGQRRQAADQRAKSLLGRLGLADRLSHRPAKLSGGEQQRVAIARALANQPKLILADEPTGNLDPETADEVFALLMEVVRESDSAALVATHNPDLAGQMDRTLTMGSGVLSAQQTTASTSVANSAQFETGLA